MFMTIDEARKKGITKVRLERWAVPEDYLDITHTIIGKLFSPTQETIIKVPYGSQTMMIFQDTSDEWVEYIEPKEHSQHWLDFKAGKRF